MRRTGRAVNGRGWRSARHHSRTRRKAPRGVAPSPSNLLALMPARPSATGSVSAPAVSQPCVGRPGRGRTKILARVRFFIRCRILTWPSLPARRLWPKYQFALALSALNALLRPHCRMWARPAAREGAPGSHVQQADHPDRRRRHRAARGAGRATGAARGIRGHRRRQRHQGGAGGQKRPDRPGDHGRRPARRRRARGRAHPAQERLQGADHHADRPRYRQRHHPRPRVRRQRLRRQAVPLRRAAGAHPRPASPARGERGCGLHHRALYLPAVVQGAAHAQGHARCA